jgi:hypothetical protein
MPRAFPVAACLLFSLLLVASAPALRAQTNGTPERFTAAAINVNRGAAGNIEIQVKRWSSDAERETLLAILRDKGPDHLLDALRKMPTKGFFRAPGRLGWDIHFARRMPLPDGGERVILATDRRISFFEQTRQPRSIDYPFTIIELRLNGEGLGEGKMSIATKITEDPDQHVITLENYALQPVLLTQVKREGPPSSH